MSSQPPNVFVSYSHKDEEHKERLLVHLRGLVRQGVISTWHDGLLVPGSHWDEKIVRNLDASRIILLLISPDFIGSEYVETVELKRAAERHARGEAVVIPVLVKSTLWTEVKFGEGTLGALHALPHKLKFITAWRDKDTAYAEVAAGVASTAADLPDDAPPEDGKPAAEPEADPPEAWRVRIPDEPSSGVVPRQDQEARDIVSHLVERLAPGRKGYVLLSGAGGVGKTTLAAEAARQLEKLYAERVVWSNAAGREQYMLSSLLEDVVLKLGGPEECARPGYARKEAEAEKAVAELLKRGPSLVVIDGYEAAEPAERRQIERWFQEQAPCPALFVSQARITRLDVHNVFVLPMRPAEEAELLKRLLREVKHKHIFTDEVCECVYDAADGNPLAMRLIVPQIDLATGTEGVFEELMRGEGEAADRAFNRAFERHLEADDRAVLLALSLFTPNAAHRPLARVAGFIPPPKPGEEPDDRRPHDPATRRGMNRLYKAVANLNLFSLLKVESRKPEVAGREPCAGQLPQDEEQGCRLALETLTRRLARATLPKQPRAGGFKSRFVEHFRWHANKFDWAGCKDPGAVQAERSNVVAAMKLSAERKDWDTVLELFAVTLNYVNTLVVWKRSVVAAEREAESSLLRKGWRAPLLIEINHRHEHREEARKHYKSIPANLRMEGVASHADLISFEPPPPEELLREEKGKLVVLSVVSFELGVCAYYRAKYRRDEGALKAAKRLGEQARGYFEAAKRLKQAFRDECGRAIACNNLGVTLAVEGLAGAGVEDWRARALAELQEAKKTFEEQRIKHGKFEKFEKAAEHNLEWLESLRD
ncbi:MAG: toll/interleukin-1 receptor domain-containing protein [Acidobacteria bacterium]|nr:toll/interleukin-1 receptor domain-containing protein [Acidobacteriota bacterium]